MVRMNHSQDSERRSQCRIRALSAGALLVSIALLAIRCNASGAVSSGGSETTIADLRDSDEPVDPPQLYPIKIGNRYGYIDNTGGVRIPATFQEAHRFVGRLARVRLDGLVGFVNADGELVIEPRFANAADFSEGLAAVTEPGGFLGFFPGTDLLGPAKVGFIDESGRYVIEPEYIAEVKRTGFREGLACVRLGWKDRYGFIDRAGEFVIAPTFDKAVSFSEGLAYVRSGGRKTFIDKSGKIQIDVSRFAGTALYFREGLLSVRVMVESGGQLAEKAGFIDRTGELVVPPVFEEVGNFQEGLAAARISLEGSGRSSDGSSSPGENWGYIDKSGKMVIQPREYSSIWGFSEGRAAVKVGERWGYIDVTGEMVIPPRFDSAGAFQNGLGRVRIGDKWETYDNGRGRRLVLGRMGYVNESGKVLWAPDD